MSFEMLKTLVHSILATFADMDWTRILISVAVVLFVALTRGFIARACLNLLDTILQQFDISFAKPFREAIQPAAEMFVFAIGLIIALGVAKPGGQIGIIFEKVAISILVTSLFFGSFASTHLSATLLQGQSPRREAMSLAWLERILKVVVVALGVASVLKIWGIDLGPMLTGVGVAGAAAALAAQDLFKNFIGGMSNIAEQRFKVGDWIRAEGVVEGIVEDIALRSTAVRQFDMSLVHVPNGDLANASLVNVSKMRYRRITMVIKLHYGTNVDQLSQISRSIKTYISSSPVFAQPPLASQYVRVENFSETAIDLLVYCFTVSTTYADYLDAKEGLIFEIKRIVTEANAQFSHESRTVFIESAADIVAEQGDHAQ